MAAVGGSVEAITIAGRLFPVTQDADTQRKLGGFENDVQANGDGTARLLKTRVPLSLAGIVVQVDDSRGDHEFLQDLNDSNDFFTIAITYASGETYQGTGQVTGELQYNSAAATATLALMGPGTLTKQ